MKGIKLDIANKQIIMNKTFEDKINSGENSNELATYMELKALHPDFTFVVKKQKTYNHEKYKGLGYRLMIAYIYCHEPDEESRNRVLSELMEEKWKAMGHTCGFHEVRAWFLQKYPDYDHLYFQKHEELPKAIIDRILKACDIHSGGKLLKNKEIQEMIGKDYENIYGMAKIA